jgi:hypothetical protein
MGVPFHPDDIKYTSSNLAAITILRDMPCPMVAICIFQTHLAHHIDDAEQLHVHGDQDGAQHKT